MRYVKKMCILRQIKQGFSGDGKTLSGLIKIEQYGKNLAVEVSIINFAPLVSGEYYCLLSDGKGKTEMLSLRGKSIFNILSDIDVSGGFCGIICYVKTEIVPIAYGINGNGSYDWKAILHRALPPVFPKKKKATPSGEIAGSEKPSASAPLLFEEENEPTTYEINAPIPVKTPAQTEYDDEAVATDNYYEEKEDERVQPKQIDENARIESATENQAPQKGTNAAQDVHAAGVFEAVKLDPDGYYLSVKRELDELFSKYPQDKTLCKAFSRSEWVRIKGTAAAPEYLVGALYEDGKAKYICYALRATDKNEPPEEIKNVCSYVPVSPLLGAEGFFVIFQSAATGECVKPSRT